jgi:hypothetical protein
LDAADDSAFDEPSAANFCLRAFCSFQACNLACLSALIFCSASSSALAVGLEASAFAVLGREEVYTVSIALFQ